MKVKVTKRDLVGSVYMDAFILWLAGKMPGECYERICLKYGKEHWLYRPSTQGERCPSNGAHQGIECRCDECDWACSCWGSEPMTKEEIDEATTILWLKMRCGKQKNPG